MPPCSNPRPTAWNRCQTIPTYRTRFSHFWRIRRRIPAFDTHAASVFLGGNHALKIKRAVRFPYLDYSTLAKRKAACDEEMKINRLFAPQIYRRVVPITQGSNGQLSIDGDGVPVEYGIEMTRFDERRTMDHLAGEMDHELVDSIADAIAAAHAARRSHLRPTIE